MVFLLDGIAQGSKHSRLRALDGCEINALEHAGYVTQAS